MDDVVGEGFSARGVLVNEQNWLAGAARRIAFDCDTNRTVSHAAPIDLKQLIGIVDTFRRTFFVCECSEVTWRRGTIRDVEANKDRKEETPARKQHDEVFGRETVEGILTGLSSRFIIETTSLWLLSAKPGA